MSATQAREALPALTLHDIRRVFGLAMSEAYVAESKQKRVLETATHAIQSNYRALAALPDDGRECRCTGLQTAHNRGCPYYIRPSRRGVAALPDDGREGLQQSMRLNGALESIEEAGNAADHAP